jgi:anti-sigma B factor antagonist
MDVTITPDGDARFIITCPRQMEWNARVNLVETVRQATTGQAVRGVIIDLAGVTYINSAGLGAIFALRKFVEDAGGVLAVARPNISIARLLRTVNLSRLVSVTETLEEARAALPATHPIS